MKNFAYNAFGNYYQRPWEGPGEPRAIGRQGRCQNGKLSDKNFEALKFFGSSDGVKSRAPLENVGKGVPQIG